MSRKFKIALLTNFSEINHGYSLTGIVEDQMEMLRAYGHEAVLFVREGFKTESTREPVRDLIPKADLIDYRSRSDLSREHQLVADLTAEVLVRELKGFDFAFSHDWFFTGWNLPHFLGVLKAAGRLPGLRWLHWIHSVPTARRDWWDVRELRPGHKLIYPNSADALRAAEAYLGDLSDVRVIPHTKDPRTWFGFGEETRAFLDRYPGPLQAEVVQLLPASADRLRWKRVDKVIELFAWFKKLGRSVSLIVANQWATGRVHREETEEYYNLARRKGLIPGEEVVFSSDFGPEYEAGLPRRMIRELFQLSNLFIFPTHHESFGLVVPEAALAGCFLVLNRSLEQQLEISGGRTLAYEFGSYEREVRRGPTEESWLEAAAGQILARMDRNEAIRTRTHFRRTLNRDAVYRNHYAPVFAELSDPEKEN